MKTGGKAATTRVHAKPRPTTREHMLVEVEGTMDRLIFELLESGGVEQTEASLRGALRVVVCAQKAYGLRTDRGERTILHADRSRR
jgi:hypothetical protein